MGSFFEARKKQREAEEAAAIARTFKEKQTIQTQYLPLMPEKKPDKKQQNFGIVPLAVITVIILTAAYVLYFGSITTSPIPVELTNPNYSCSGGLCEKVGISEQASVSVTGKYPRYLPMFRLPKQFGDQDFEGIHSFFFNILLPGIMLIAIVYDVWRYKTWNKPSQQHYGGKSKAYGEQYGMSTGRDSRDGSGLPFLR